MNRRILAPLALLTLALAIPSIAGAAVRCVPFDEPGCDSDHTTIADAETNSGDGDEIRIGPGIYMEAVATDKRLHFVGAGPGTLNSQSGATVIAPIAGTALAMREGGSVRSLRAIGSDGLISGGGLVFSPIVDGNYAYDVDNVIALAGVTTDISAGSDGLRAVGSSAARTIDLDIAGSIFRGGAGGISPGRGASVFGVGASATFSRSSLLPAEGANSGEGLNATVGARVELVETTVRGSVAARFSGGDSEIRRSTLAGGNGAGLLVSSGGPGTPTSMTVVNSLITSSPNFAPGESAALLALTGSGGDEVSVTVRGSTIAGDGEDPDAAVRAFDNDAGSPEVSIDLRNSVAVLADDGGNAELLADRGTITASHSSFNSVVAENGGSAPAAGSGSNVAGDPLLGGDYLPGESSPLVDAGDPGIVSDGELDLAGNPRSLDGNGNCEAAPDIGALERPSTCDPPSPDDGPPAVNPPPAISRVTLARRAFTALKPRRKGRRRGTAFRFALSEPARVRIAFFRRAPGRVVGRKGRRRCVKPTRRNRARPRCRRWARAGAINRRGRAGRNRIRFSGVIRRRPPRRGRRALRPGRYVAVFVAIDAEGARSKRRAVAFRVLRP